MDMKFNYKNIIITLVTIAVIVVSIIMINAHHNSSNTSDTVIASNTTVVAKQVENSDVTSTSNSTEGKHDQDIVKSQNTRSEVTFDDKFKDLIEADVHELGKKLEHTLVLNEVVETIKSLNNGFDDEHFEELPPNTKIVFKPTTKAKEMKGRYIEYRCDANGNPITAKSYAKITDYGNFTSTLSNFDTDKNTFDQRISFLNPTTYYSPIHKQTADQYGRDNEEWLFQWTEDGPSYIPRENEKVRRTPFPPFDMLMNKVINKGDVFHEKVKSRDGSFIDMEINVLGYKEVNGHRCVVVERNIERDLDLSSNPKLKQYNLPPVHRETKQRLYFDIDLKFPIRSEYIYKQTYQPEHFEEPQVYVLMGTFHPDKSTNITYKKRVLQIFY